MLFTLRQALLVLSFTSACLSQTAKVPLNRFASEIPAAEAKALAGILEDDPAGVPTTRKGGSTTPAYTLYSAALVIPPVAQVKQYVIYN